MNRNHVIVAGMPRSATTYLYHMLQRHPQIFTPYIKEINYFVAKYDRGIDWYVELFKDAAPYQITFDVSPATFLDPEADQRIMQHFPQAKILVMVRDPLEWCLSFYSQFKSFELVDAVIRGVRSRPYLYPWLGHDHRAFRERLRADPH